LFLSFPPFPDSLLLLFCDGCLHHWSLKKRWNPES
jgi:hypothetical protein